MRRYMRTRLQPFRAEVVRNEGCIRLDASVESVNGPFTAGMVDSTG